MRPIVSNVETATCETAKFLNSLLAPLGKSNASVLRMLRSDFPNGA